MTIAGRPAFQRASVRWQWRFFPASEWAVPHSLYVRCPASSKRSRLPEVVRGRIRRARNHRRASVPVRPLAPAGRCASSFPPRDTEHDISVRCAARWLTSHSPLESQDSATRSPRLRGAAPVLDFARCNARPAHNEFGRERCGRNSRAAIVGPADPGEAFIFAAEKEQRLRGEALLPLRRLFLHRPRDRLRQRVMQSKSDKIGGSLIPPMRQVSPIPSDG
jgi:hypothetical protein